MRNKRKTIPAAALLITALWLAVFSAAGGEELTGTFNTEEWTWDAGTVNTFTGTADLSPWAGSEVTLRMEAEPEPRPEEGETSTPLFVIVNGKRIAMMSQKDTAVLTAGAEAIPFTCSYRMPKETRCNGVSLRLTVLDGQGNELGHAETKIGYGSRGGGNGSSFRIPFEIRTVALWAAIAGALAWIAAAARNRLLHQKH